MSCCTCNTLEGELVLLVVIIGQLWVRVRVTRGRASVARSHNRPVMAADTVH